MLGDPCKYLCSHSGKKVITSDPFGKKIEKIYKEKTNGRGVKSDGQEKSTKILISWQELKKKIKLLPPKAFYWCEKLEDRFSMSQSQTVLIINLKFANINLTRVRKGSRMEKLGHFP